LKLKSQAHRTTVNSSTISHRPRVARNRATSLRLRPLASDRNALVPARKTKTGAQKCVIHRVKNSATDVCERSVGSKRTEVR
jgi:hypothetical protein